MPLPLSGRLLGIDWGRVRTGLALTDETQTVASPLDTLAQRPGKRFPMRRLLEVVEARQAVGVLLGLPLGPEGDDTPSTVAVRELAERLRPHLAVPLELWDERLTTARALRTIREQGGSVRGRREEVDALSAAILLQHYLDSRGAHP